LRILHVIRGLANSSGTTHIVGPLAEAQSRLGHDVEVYYVEKTNETSVEADPSLVRSTQFPMTFRSRHYGYSRPFAKTLRRQIRTFDIVHIHAIWNYVTWRAMYESRRGKVPYIVAPQGSLEDWALGRSRHLKRGYAALLEKPLFDRAAAMQALTEAEVRQCKKFRIASPAEILPNGVDLQLIDKAGPPESTRTLHGLPSDERLILFLGRIFPKKGIDILADGFSRFAQNHPKVTLLVAGHDAGQGYLAHLQQRLKQSGGDQRAIFLGEIRGAEKFRLLRSADLFVLPSYSEGLPIAVLEAMACSTPVLITPGCNLPEVSRYEAGWECSPDADSFQAALESIFAAPESLPERGKRARRLVEERFTWPKVAAASIELYQRFSRNSTS